MTYVFSDSARAVLRSLVPVICPPEAAHLADAIIDHMQLTIGALPAVARAGLLAGLAGYDTAALARYGRRARALTGERAEAYYAAWEHGLPPQHEFAKVLNQLMSLSCYEQPEMAARCGFHPAEWIDEVSRKRLRVYGDAVRAQQAALLAPDPLIPGAADGRR